MAFISGLLVGCVLSAFALGLLCILLVLHRPATAPTKYRRQWRDLPTPPVVPSWEREEKPVEPIYMYGVTGLEE